MLVVGSNSNLFSGRTGNTEVANDCDDDLSLN